MSPRRSTRIDNLKLSLGDTKQPLIEKKRRNINRRIRSKQTNLTRQSAPSAGGDLIISDATEQAPTEGSQHESQISSDISNNQSENSSDLNIYDPINDDDESSDEIERLQSLDNKSALEYLRNNYTNPNSPLCYASVSGVKKIFKNLSEDEIKGCLSKFESWSLMKSSRDDHVYNPFIAYNIRDCFQIDCISLVELAEYNSGITHLLCVLDVFTKFLWVSPMWSTTGAETAKTLNGIFKDMMILPECIVSGNIYLFICLIIYFYLKLCADSGPEFKNKIVMKMLKDLKINLIFSQSSFKASCVERAQYTLERLIFSHITAHETLKYVDVLQSIVARYNKSKHSFTGFTPLEVESSDVKQDLVLSKFMKRYSKIKSKEPKFSIGDTVRILLFKSPFHRGYNIQRSYERFKVHKVIKNKVPLYILADEKENIIFGFFHDFELVKVNLSRYRVIIKDSKVKNGKTWHHLHYKGYSDQYDSWEPEDDVVDLKDERLS